MLMKANYDNPRYLLLNGISKGNCNLEFINFLESLNDGIIVLNEFGIVTNVNSTFEKLVNVSASLCIGVDIRKMPNLGKISDFIYDKIVGKIGFISMLEKIHGREVLVSANYIIDNYDKTKIIVLFKDLVKLNKLVENHMVTKARDKKDTSTVDNTVELLNREQIVVGSEMMKKIFILARRVAQVDSSVLISGETGVGKEVLARVIHECSRRISGPYIKLDCSTISEHLMESELFGYEAGAFTGARKEGKPGLIELADGGTLFLDEIGEIPVNIQVKLLGVLQEREIRRVGSTKVKKVDFRLIVATNKNLEEMIVQKKFRKDLFYRLNVVHIKIPPLRERQEDIIHLGLLFLKKFNKKYAMDKKISPKVIQSFLRYEWPGNVRELENTIERLVVTSDSNVILMDDLMEKTKIESERIPGLRNTVEETEKNLLVHAIQHCKSTREMAVILGISQSSVVKKMRKYGLSNLAKNTEKPQA